MALRGAGEHDEAERVFADAVETARTRRQAEWLRYALFPWTRILLEEGRLIQAELCARELVESGVSRNQDPLRRASRPRGCPRHRC